MNVEFWMLEGGSARLSTDYRVSVSQTEHAVAMFCLYMTMDPVYKFGLLQLVRFRLAPTCYSL